MSDLEVSLKGSAGANTMQYKGYLGKIEYDDEAGIFHGEVINLRDVITFQGECISDLRQAFQDSVEDYLELCAERGEQPEKPFSGKFVVRVDPELHRRIYVVARQSNQSINRWVSDTLRKSLSEKG